MAISMYGALCLPMNPPAPSFVSKGFLHGGHKTNLWKPTRSNAMCSTPKPCLGSSAYTKDEPSTIGTAARKGAGPWHACIGLDSRSWRLSSNDGSSVAISFRKATQEDMSTIQKMVFEEKMNPLGLDHANFIVAEDSNGRIQGFAQIEAKPSKDKPEYMEFRSMVVEKNSRRKGIGSALVSELLAGFADDDIYMTTIDRNVSFYEKFGFKEIEADSMPRALWLEWIAGNLVAKLAVNERCLVMKLSSKALNT